MNFGSWTATWLTLELALATTVALLLIATPLAWWLARTGSRWRRLVEAVTALPLVLPPTVLGFYLLLLLAPRRPVGRIWMAMGGEQLTFSFSGLLIGSVLYSLPFAVQPLLNAFQSVPEEVLEAAACLHSGPWDRFVNVAVPLARGGFFSAAILSFAHTVGEFGVVLMVGGNIPGRTQVLSIWIFDRVEQLDYESAHWQAAGLLVFSLVVLLLVSGRRSRVAAGTA